MKQQNKSWFYLLMFLLTVVSTTVTGGLAYSISLLSILVFHEFGHYFTAKRYGVPASLPLFIPFPTIFGTMGAVIAMKGNIPTRKALFDIGIAGPLAGLVLAIPLTLIGIALSEPVFVEPGEKLLRLGDSLFFLVATKVIHGDLLANQELLLHPVGFAGWAGLFVTALNLLPIGQLDGGHIIYAMFPKKSALIYKTLFFALAAVTVFINSSWFLFVLILFFFIKLRHPPTLYDALPLDKTRYQIGLGALIFFLVSFPPVPISIG